MEKEEFISLITRYREGRATELEEQQLANYFSSFQEPGWNEERYGPQAESVARIRQNLLAKIDTATPGDPVLPLHRVHFLRRSWIRYAAAVILLIGTASALFVLQPWKKGPTEIAAAKPITDIPPASKKAYLTLGNGKKVELQDIQPGERIEGAVKTADGKLIYSGSSNLTQAVVYNTITVPRGGEPQYVQLPDHSEVWVNTESSVTYPTAFTGDTRTVQMIGEAYFEVAKNGKPFIVQTRADRIEVMGTHFNINSYNDEAVVRTTLLEGKVRIGTTILAPDEQYANGKVTKIDAAAMQRVMAWKNGLFAYDKVDVQTLMRDLGRYYDVEVVFEGEPTKRTFEGKIGRSLSLKDVLDGLHFTELNYRLEKGATGNRIVMLP